MKRLFLGLVLFTGLAMSSIAEVKPTAKKQITLEVKCSQNKEVDRQEVKGSYLYIYYTDGTVDIIHLNRPPITISIPT